MVYNISNEDKNQGGITMNIEKYTQNAQAAVEGQRIAIENGNPSLEPEHINLALLQQSDGLIPRLLKYGNRC